MSSPRQLTSMGYTQWSATRVDALDSPLSSFLLDNMTARLAVLGRDQCYLYANREMLDFLRRPAAEVIGRPLAEIVGAAAYAGYAPLAERVWRGETLRLEGWVEYPGRGPRYLAETFVPYRGHGESTEMVAVFGRDHTDLKLRERDLADRMAQLHTSEALKASIFDHAIVALVSTDAAGNIV